MPLIVWMKEVEMSVVGKILFRNWNCSAGYFGASGPMDDAILAVDVEYFSWWDHVWLS